MHGTGMLSRVRLYFKDAHVARMSDGTYCIIRDLGLVKGGKGMRHHEVLMTMNLKALSRQIRARSLSFIRSLARRVGSSGSRQSVENDSANNLPAPKS
jgi:hypothetical protein